MNIFMKSPNILIIDANSTYHVGNTALLDSSIEQLKEGFPNANFTILAFDPKSISKMFTEHKVIEALWSKPFSAFTNIQKIGWLTRESIWITINSLNLLLKKYIKIKINPKIYTFSPIKRAVLKAYNDCDIVVSISGEMLSEENHQRLGLFLYGYWLGYIMHKTVAIFPQSMGPFRKFFAKNVGGYILDHCHLVCPRDKISYNHIQKLSLNKTKILLAPDVAVNQPAISAEQAKSLLQSSEVNIERRPVVGLSISKFHNKDYEKYYSGMKTICNEVLEKHKGSVVLLSPNFPFQNETSDFSVAEKLYNDLNSKENVTLIKEMYSARQFKGVLGELDAFFTTRMHVAILATMALTPTVTINTQVKLRGYMEMIDNGQWACDVNNFTNAKALELLTSLLSNKESMKLNLEKARARVTQESKQATVQLKQIFESRNS